MRFIMRFHALLIPALALVVQAAPIVTVPPRLQPGSQYRLVFVTLGARDATSANIEDYDRFVAQAANSVPALSELGTT
jgi:hypothetical protein